MIPLEQLRSNTCRFPHGDGPYLFCGDPVQPGSSYCPHHHECCCNRPPMSRGEIEANKRKHLRKAREEKRENPFA